MNIRETATIRSPNGIEEKCAKFTIDDIAMPFVFESVTDIDEKYVFSAWMMSDGNSSITVENNELSLSTEWQKQKVVFNASDNSLKIYFNNIGIYYFYHSQLESGNIGTDWSPAPEDIEAELEIKVNTDDLISEINASANVIRLKSNRLVVESDNLQIAEDGSITANNGTFTGDIVADSFVSENEDFKVEMESGVTVTSKSEGYMSSVGAVTGFKDEVGGYLAMYMYPNEISAMYDDEYASLYFNGDEWMMTHGLFTDKITSYGNINAYGNIYTDKDIYLQNTKTLRAYTTDGESKLITGINTNDVLLFGTTDMNSQIRSNGLYITSASAGLTNRQYGVNKVLWTGQHWMNANHTATLSEAVSAQPNGIILVFSNYNDGADDSHFNCYFVPKQIVALKGGKGHGIFAPGNGALTTACYAKYLYIYDTKIVGNDSNDASSRTSASGITHQNNRGVMRYVIGV